MAIPKRINILYGSWRSSKSVAVDLKFLMDILKLPDGNILLVGNTINSLQRNVISVLKSIIGTRNIDIKRQSKELDIFGRTVWIEGADKEDAYKRIEGESLVCAYIDEWSHVPESFTSTLMSRLSDPGARMYATCNPESPGHYIYRKYIQRADALDIALWKFTLDDNPWLDPAYKQSIVAENPPGTIFYDRNILGNWVAASGLVFANFDPSHHVSATPPALKPKELRIGVDYGTHNPAAFVSIEKYLVPGRIRPTWYVTREYYWDSQVMYEQKTDLEYSRDLASYLSGTWVQPDKLRYPLEGGACESTPSELHPVAMYQHPTTIEVDPSAASFILQLQRDGMRRARAANSDVLGGIRKIATMISSGDLVITQRCPWLIHTMGTYGWKADSQVDEVVKENDHVIDALRYAINSL